MEMFVNVDLVFDEIVKRERERERERESEREFSTNNVLLRGAGTVVPVIFRRKVFGSD